MSPRRPDSRQLIRQWALLRLLAESGRELTAKELADQLQTTKSTIQRDIATLRQDFALVEELVTKQKYTYRIDQSIKALDAIQFGTTELLALHAAAGALASLSGTPLQADLENVVRKIRGFLSPRHNGGLDAIARVFHAHHRGTIDYAAHADVVDELADATARRRICQMTYSAASTGDTREHVIKPLRLIWHRACLYLLAQIRDRDDITTFAIHRIEALEPRDETFADPGLDIEEHCRRMFGIFVSDDEQDVEIVFAAEVADRVMERTYHPDEAKERLDDGRLRYRLRSSAQWEIIPWVQSFGPYAELIAPAAWRQEIREAARALTTVYADEPRPGPSE